MTPPRDIYRIMLGPKSIFADLCHREGFIGGDWNMDLDLTGQLPDDFRAFNRRFIPVFLEKHPDKTRVAAGLACGMLFNICKGIHQGDLILSPDGEGAYFVGEVISDYAYVPGGPLPHRRRVNWYPRRIARDDMSEDLAKSAGTPGSVRRLTKFADEIEHLLGGDARSAIPAPEGVEDPLGFALEKHLEDFLVKNWASLDLARDYTIYEEEGEPVGQQYPSDTGPIDLLAVRNDRTELLVIELKKGKASDAVVGQIQRYMGYVQEELAEPGQTVRGIIIAMDDDLRIRRALAVAGNIDFYRYHVSFKLEKA